MIVRSTVKSVLDIRRQDAGVDGLEAGLAAVDDPRRRLLEALLAEARAPAGERELEAAE